MLARLIFNDSNIIATIVTALKKSDYVILKLSQGSISFTSKKNLPPSEFKKQVDNLVDDFRHLDKDLKAYVPNTPTFFK